MDFGFAYGTVLAVDSDALDFRRINIPIIHVKSDNDGAVLPIPWLPIAPQQFMPMAGHRVFLVRIGNFDTRILASWGNNADYIRKGAVGLDEGEAVMQSDSGLGYVKLDKAGGVNLVTGDACSFLEGNIDGWDMKAPNITLETYGGGTIAVQEDGSITMKKADSSGNVKVSLELDKDNNLRAFAEGDIVLKGKNILLDGKMKMGPGASDPSQSFRFGKVVTAGPFGTHPFDFVTGAPILGSRNVDVSA